MRNIICLLFVSIFTSVSCSDGDVFTVEFDFEDTFEGCEESELLFFKTKEDPSESISILFNSFSYAELFATAQDSLRFMGDTLAFSLPASFNYRTYNRADLPNNLFCSILPPANLNIQTDAEDTSVTVDITNIIMEDDNDGIPFIFENPDPNGDGNFDDAQDTDGDGLPDFIDEDDDGDNVLTRDENPDPDGNGNPIDAQNTDGEFINGDAIADYLDPDDDGDGTLTINEENVLQNKNPLDDVTNPNVGPDFLNPNFAENIPANGFRQHEIIQTFTVRAIIRDINLDFISQDVLGFGILNNTDDANFPLNSTRTATPIFP